MKKLGLVVAAMGITAVAMGCGTERDTDDAPDLDEADALGEQLTSGSWTLTPNKPYVVNGGVRAKGVLSGPTGQTVQAGGCLLQRVEGSCSAPSDCPAFPSGGGNYCISGKCWQRRGSPSDLCFGFPKTGLYIGAGTYTSNPFPYEDGVFVTRVCFGPGSCADGQSSSAFGALTCDPAVNCCDGNVVVPCYY